MSRYRDPQPQVGKKYLHNVQFELKNTPIWKITPSDFLVWRINKKAEDML